jgi:hypothetical protein
LKAEEMKRFLVLALLWGLAPSEARAVEFEARSEELLKARNRIIEAGMEFLHSAQNPEGSFGQTQKNFQTALAVLAFLSAGITPADEERGDELVRAYQWLFSRSGEDGFAGDSEYPHESHAVVGLAFACLIGMGTSPEENLRIAGEADRAMDYSLRIQNQAVGADYFGGWTPDPRVKVNDRIVTACHLLFLRAMRYAGRDVPKRAISRATEFMLGSQKDPQESEKRYEKEDIGGFSYDAGGLPVVSATSAGLAILTLFDLSAHKRELAANWLKEHPPVWYGPNFYQTHFFGARGMLHHARMTRDPKVFDRYFRRLFHLLKDHQSPDGSFEVPPGNAENTKVMGKTYATAMALLLLNVDRELLPVDMEP